MAALGWKYDYISLSYSFTLLMIIRYKYHFEVEMSYDNVAAITACLIVAGFIFRAQAWKA